MLRLFFRPCHAIARRPYSTAAPSTPSPARYSRFTPQEDEKIRRLRLEGHKFSTIAKALGRSEESTHHRWRLYISPGLSDIPRHLQNTGFSPRALEQAAELVKAGHGTQEIVNRLGLSYHTAVRYQKYVRQGKSRTRKPSKPASWGPEEESELLRMYENGMPDATMAEQLQRSIPSIKGRLRMLVQKGRMVFDKAPRWLPEHEELLRSLVTQKLPWQEIVEHFPGRTMNSVRERWRELCGRARPSARPPFRWYTPEELAQLHKLKENNLSWKEIADQFPGRTSGSVRKKWTKRNDYKRAGHRRIDWTREEVERLQQLVHQLGHDWNAIGKQLDRSRDSVYTMHRLVVLGLANTLLMPATQGS